MSREFITYLTQPFSAAADLHMAPKPTDVEAFVILGKESEAGFSPDDLVKAVLRARSSTLNDDTATFEGVMIEPPEIAGREASLTVHYGESSAILGRLLVERAT